MQKRPLAVALALVCALVATSPAHARHHSKHRHSHKVTRIALAESQGCLFTNEGRTICQGAIQRASDSPMGRRIVAPSNGYDMADSGADPRPGRWCMWWLRRHLGIARSAFPKWGYNIAANGQFIGSPASGPAPGVIVVWRHHVGVITGGSPGHWIVLSGNDGNAVRERERPLNGIIAYRWPHSQFAMR